MGTFAPALFLQALKAYGYEMSDQAIEPYLKLQIRDFLSAERSPVEVYDFCDKLSKLPCDRYGTNEAGGAKFSIGDIDSFGQALFDVTKFYTRPDDK